MKTLFNRWTEFFHDDEVDTRRGASIETRIGDTWQTDGHRDPGYTLYWLDCSKELVLHKSGQGGVVDPGEKHFAIEAFLVPAGAVQVIGWALEDPRRLLDPIDHDDNSLQRLKDSIVRHALDRPVA